MFVFWMINEFKNYLPIFTKCQVFRSGEEQGMIERISRDLRFTNVSPNLILAF